MNFTELKELLGEEGKVIVVEDNKPVMVALTYEQYKKEKGQVVKKEVVQPIVETVAEASRPQERPMSGTGELTIDDLPL